MLDYGIVGNCKTSALVSSSGSIDWMCFPRFDSQSAFARLLDKEKGGHWQFIPDKKADFGQRYLPNTNIIETVVKGEGFSFRIIDFFPRYKKILPNKKKKMFKINKLVRIVEPISGKPRIRMEFRPRLDYARGDTAIISEEKSILVRNNGQEMALITNVEHQFVMHEDFFELNQRKYFIFGETSDDYNVKKCLRLLTATERYWEKWVSTLVVPKKHRELIIRSALTLKLLTYSETGAIIAAATTSIPEEAGTVRCWDYRYCWIRDAAFCADAFKKIGRDYESKRLMEFIIDLVLKNDYIQPLYSITGETRIKESTLDHLEGFDGSRPVRIGNAAYRQIQNDIYGEVIDIMYLYFVYHQYEGRMTKRYWRFLKYTVNQIKFNWDRKDSGIWEFRGIHEHYVFSKLLCYVGMDRAIRIAQHFERDDLAEEWVKIRDEIKNDILTNGYGTKVSAFTIHYGASSLDAANLLMSYYEFLDSTDPRLINTIKASYNKLMHNDYLVQRYTMEDDFGKSKSAFTVCSFWLIDSLIYIGEKEKAEKIFENILKRCNSMCLYSEDIDIKSGQLIGNFPQAYVHIALINSSVLMSEWSTKRKKIDYEGKKRMTWF